MSAALVALAGVGIVATRSVAAADQAAAPSAANAAASASATASREMLDKYCVTCHNDRLKTAGLSLQGLDVTRVSASAPVWEKVVKKLRGAAMPPAGMPRPSTAVVDSFVSRMETALDQAGTATPNPGRPAIHRLNRAEYANAIRDILGLELDASTLLPVDDQAYGFDNIADSLSISPALLDRYLSVARRVSALAIGDPGIHPVAETYNISKLLVQEERMSEDLPFGSRGGVAIRHYFPVDGEYTATIAFAERTDLQVRVDGVLVGTLKPPAGGPGAFATITPQEIRLPVKAGSRLLGLSFVESMTAAEGYGAGRARGAGVSRVEIAGPYNPTGVTETTPRRQIFVCRPAGRSDEMPCATKIVSTLARRAYRRPVTSDDVLTLLGFYTAARTAGESFDIGIQRALVRLLVSPDFLFRIERNSPNAPGAAHRINDIELASRLSFFIWSSVPDEQLLRLAERGRLSEPGVLEAQVRRMLKDPRSRALVQNFAAQWLFLRNLRTATPDVFQFPEFDDNLRDAMRQETELFIESQLRADRPLIDLLQANYTFLNERLARHYGIRGVYGSRLRRVTVSDDRRVGLLGQASVLTVTSYAHRTSVVQRGKWILDNILGTPPPPPPPDVPPLDENIGAFKPRSLRDRMEQHRRNPACSVCHARMDPVGFALENFDAIGAWRTTDAGMPIDTSGALPDGTKLNGPVDLRKALLDRRGEFVTAVTEKLLTYALGRGIDYFDQPAIRQILRDAAPGEYRWSAIVLGIVKSVPFRMRMAPDKAPALSASSRRTEQ